MSETKIYHIYLKDRCVYHCIPEEEFKSHWDNLKYLTDLMGGSKYRISDLSYEELTVNKKAAAESSH